MAKDKQNNKKQKSQYQSYETYCGQPSFNLTRVFLGVLIILGGIFIFLENFGLVNINFNLWKLWPVLIILIGLACLDKKSIVATWIGILAIFVTIFLVIIAVLGPKFFWEFPAYIHQDTNMISPSVSTPSIVKMKVKLFYYNSKLDQDMTCGEDFILPVEREILVTGSPIKDTIELLIKGYLTEEEKAEGYDPQFPNPDFKLLRADLENGVLTLEFSEVPGFTDGGACRMNILTKEIIQTAKQFPGVKEVVLKPDTLFQP